jgi:IS30 family transposase
LPLKRVAYENLNGMINQYSKKNSFAVLTKKERYQIRNILNDRHKKVVYLRPLMKSQPKNLIISMLIVFIS